MTGRPRAAIVVTGSELVRGECRDDNGPFLANELVRLGADPARVTIVGDRPEELEAAVREGLEADICLLSGGLGPTHDDRTVEILARAAGRRLETDPALEREIESVSRGIATRFGRPYADFAPGVAKQASLPAGARSLGLAGTAPGVLLELGGRVAVALPGPPPELRRLWAKAVEAPELQAVLRRAPPRDHRVLRFFGPSESAVAQALDEQGGETTGVEVTVCARDFEVHVDLFVDESGAGHGAGLERALRARFGNQLFAEDERPLEELILALARARGWTIATAESCTGGMVGARLTGIAGSSDAYLGGLVAYSDSVKASQLDVSENVLERHGAVSAEVAAAMAAGARRALGADVAAAVTGIAGPGGATAGKPVGLVFLHVETPEGAEQLRFELPGDRASVRSRATALLLHLIRHALTRSGDASA